MISIFPLLAPSLQAKLAQYALLTQRAAVLAALPVMPNGKGRSIQWATQPPPELLRNVVYFAGKAAAPKVGRLLLRLWFQKKPELRAAVHRALEAENYPLPLLADCTEPSRYNVRLGPDDIRQQEAQLFFYPHQHPVPGAAGASAEEVTLMAHLLGWTVLPQTASEIPPAAPGLQKVADYYEVVQDVGLVARRLLACLPPELAAAVQGGTIIEELAPYWPDDSWASMHTTLSNTRTGLQKLLDKPLSPAEAPLHLPELTQLLEGLEGQYIGHYIHAQHRRLALDVLARVDGLRHQQQSDFAPLAALREHTAALRAIFETEWPDDKEAVYPPWARVLELVAQARVYRLLLHLVQHPAELATLDETSEDYQQLEAATPPGVLNALLLRRLHEAPPRGRFSN
jgi:hypothetical protein